MLVEKQNREVYDEAVETFFRTQRSQVLSRLQDKMGETGQRHRFTALAAGTLQSQDPPSESSDLGWFAFVILCLLTLMSNAVGRWLSTDVTMDLKAVSIALRKLTAAERDLALPGGVALREVADVTDAFRLAMAGFADQAVSMREATCLGFQRRLHIGRSRGDGRL